MPLPTSPFPAEYATRVLHDSIDWVRRQVERASALQMPQPRLLRIPVTTRPRTCSVSPLTHGTPNEQVALVTNPEHVRTLEFDTVRVMVPDNVAALRGVEPAGEAARLAATHGPLLTTTPVATRREPVQMCTSYDFYVTTENAITALAAEHAHVAYGTAMTNLTSSQTVRLQMRDSMTAVDALTTQLRIFTQQTTVATNAFQTMYQTANGFNIGWDYANGVGVAVPRELTPEEKASLAAAEAKLVIVKDRAEKLLLAHLSEHQRKTWLADNYVLVRTPRGRTYRVDRGTHLNVYLVDQMGRKLRKYCAYADDPGGKLVAADQVFAQMVTLQFAERDFLAQANTWNLLDPSHAFVGKGVDADADVPVVMAA